MKNDKNMIGVVSEIEKRAKNDEKLDFGVLIGVVSENEGQKTQKTRKNVKK